MNAKGILTSIAALALIAAGTAGAGSNNAALLIRHQVRGCHAWSFNGNAYRATQAITLQRGTWLTVTNNDVMPHQLVKVAGGSVRFVNVKSAMTGMGMMGVPGKAARGAMNHMSASTKVFFSKAGVYKFVTKAGEDYQGMGKMKSIGEDNVLRLTVTVACGSASSRARPAALSPNG